MNLKVRFVGFVQAAVAVSLLAALPCWQTAEARAAYVASQAADGAILTLKATPAVGDSVDQAVTINLGRWSTDAERNALVVALRGGETPTESPADAEVRQTVSAVCTTCHNLDRVKNARLSKGAWSETLETMQFFGAMIKDEQIPVLVDFLSRTQAPAPNGATPTGLLAATIGRAPTIGFLWTSQLSGYAIKYAHRTLMPDATERIILAMNRRLILPGMPDEQSTTDASKAPEEQFTVLEIRFNGKGVGEAKASFDTKVVIEPQLEMIELQNYPATRTLLRQVSRRVH